MPQRVTASGQTGGAAAMLRMESREKHESRLAKPAVGDSDTEAGRCISDGGRTEDRSRAGAWNHHKGTKNTKGPLCVLCGFVVVALLRVEGFLPV